MDLDLLLILLISSLIVTVTAGQRDMNDEKYYFQICEHQLIGSKDQLFKYEVLNLGCQIKCIVLVTLPPSDPYHEYYTQRRDIDYTVPCLSGQKCVNGTCQSGHRSTRSTTTTALLPLIATTIKPTVTTIKTKFNVQIHIFDGYVPHQDAFNVGDIKVKVFVNNVHIGNTRKVQDSEWPTFNQNFVAENISGQDVINFEIWDMDPQWDDFEGRFYTTCNQVISSKTNNVLKKFRPGCQTSSNCWLNVKINCS